MQIAFEEEEPRRGWLMPAVVVLVLALLGYFLYTWIADVGSRARAPVDDTLEVVLPPPPPPPPPPPEPEPTPPEPTEEPIPQEEPTPQPEAQAPVAIDAEAQAGGDSFGLRAGKGGIGAIGGGTCIGENCGKPSGGISDRLYTSSLSRALEARVRRDDKLKREVFKVSVAVWMDGDRITRVEVVEGSGEEVDTAVLALLRGASDLPAPPATVRFPQRITIRGTRGG